MVMALDCGEEGCEFKPRRFQIIFDVKVKLVVSMNKHSNVY